MRKIWNRLQSKLDNYELKKKLHFLYMFCVLFPLIITDSIIVYNFIDAETTQKKHEMENVASAVQYSFFNSIDSTARLTKNVYSNRRINDFLEKEYEAPMEYFVSYLSMINDTMLDDCMASNNARVKLYVDNPTIINGGAVSHIEYVRQTPWYQYMAESEKDDLICFYYDKTNSSADSKRRIIFARRLDYFPNSKKEKIVVLEFDYSSIARNLIEMNYQVPIYICMDDKILFSNEGHSNALMDFEPFNEHDIGHTNHLKLYGTEIQIHVLNTRGMIVSELHEILPVFLLLLVVNFVLPQILATEINRSFTLRVQRLSEAFESVDDERLSPITPIYGSDEISSLMRNYNRMANRLNDLIQTVYKDRMREQEIDIARQRAELLALHSQINPHFLFNALESIRMHSVLKKEYETAQMVEKLAIMERQNAEWHEDCIEIQKEMQFVEAYLGLQKYRFGDRLSFQLEVDMDCNALKVPRLTIVTFVENACIHGIESKATQGWIFVRVYQEKQDLCIEVEDTGEGMEEHVMEELRQKMNHACIDLLRQKGRVGIVNACLRLKMITNDKVIFLLEGERGIGTMIQIRIPLDVL